MSFIFQDARDAEERAMIDEYIKSEYTGPDPRNALKNNHKLWYQLYHNGGDRCLVRVKWCDSRKRWEAVVIHYGIYEKPKYFKEWEECLWYGEDF